ncbi:antitoxin [Streptomyces toxytricini]|uniref:antitoxin n=1 Tax=Streptomyces toxytricini TaxID=67369 RepID=UPI00343FF8FF
MGLLDNLKARLAPAKEKAGGLVQQHEGRIGTGLDKVAGVVDAKTHGKYSDRITSGTGKAKEALGRIAHREEPGGGPTVPPASP